VSTSAVFLYIEIDFDTVWYPGLLYKLSKFEFFDQSHQTYKFISFKKKMQSLCRRQNFHTMMYTNRGARRFYLVARTIKHYINDIPQTTGVNLALSSDDMSLCDRMQGRLSPQKTPARDSFSGGLV
jgi:hypothetical protein